MISVHELLTPIVGPVGGLITEYLHIHQLSLSEAAWVFAAFIVAWSMVGAWAYMRFARRKSDEYGSRVVSVIHAAVSTVLCGVAALDGFHEPNYAEYGPHCTGLQQVAVLCTAGYFVMDFFGILCSSYFSWLYLGHHILSCSCLAYGGMLAVHGFAFSFVTTLMEVSNPFLHTRWLLIEDKEHLKHKGRGSWTFRVVDLTFYVLFFLARIVAGPIMTYRLVMAPSTPWLMKGAGFLLQVLSVQFMFENFGKRYRGELWIN